MCTGDSHVLIIQRQQLSSQPVLFHYFKLCFIVSSVPSPTAFHSYFEGHLWYIISSINISVSFLKCKDSFYFFHELLMLYFAAKRNKGKTMPAFHMLKFEDRQKKYVIHLSSFLNTVYCHFTLVFGSSFGGNPANGSQLHSIT